MKKTVSVAARITAEQAERLDEVKAMKPAVHTRSAAVGRLLDLFTADDYTPHDAAEGQEFSQLRKQLQPEDVAAVLDALNARTRAYSEMAKQLQAIGHLLNQLVRLAHQMSKFSRPGIIPEAAVDGIKRMLDGVLNNELHTLATQDHHVEEVVRACRS